MSRFHTLRVADIRRETRDAVVLTLEPGEGDRAAFAFESGQYLTLRRDFDGIELRRSYSICAGQDEGCLKVGIKRVDGGAFSTWANEELLVGAEIEAMPPMGKFSPLIDPAASRHHVGFAAGSGITPILSIIKTVLGREPKSRFTLIYANRQISSIMFREELEDIKNLYLGRLSVIHVLKAEAQDIELFTGRIDSDKMTALLKSWIDPRTVDTAFICGPESMMLTVAQSLRDHGLTDEQIRFELFASSQTGQARVRAASAAVARHGSEVAATVTLDGSTRSFAMLAEGQSLLDAAIAHQMDAPYACKAGVCSTCRCKVLSGEVEMAVNHSLEDYEVRAGYVLSCQAYPVSEAVVVTFDE